MRPTTRRTTWACSRRPHGRLRPSCRGRWSRPGGAERSRRRSCVLQGQLLVGLNLSGEACEQGAVLVAVTAVAGRRWSWWAVPAERVDLTGLVVDRVPHRPVRDVRGERGAFRLVLGLCHPSAVLAEGVESGAHAPASRSSGGG